MHHKYTTFWQHWRLLWRRISNIVLEDSILWYPKLFVLFLFHSVKRDLVLLNSFQIFLKANGDQLNVWVNELYALFNFPKDPRKYFTVSPLHHVFQIQTDSSSNKWPMERMSNEERDWLRLDFLLFCVLNALVSWDRHE